MVGSSIRRLALTVACAVLGVALAAPVHAQSGEVRGKVIGADGKPVEGAQVTIIRRDGTGQKYQITSRRDGEFRQRVPAGQYSITATKDKLTQTYEIEVKGDMEVDLRLGSTDAASKDDAARREKLQTTFAEGAKLSDAGKHDEAIAKFKEVLEVAPKCAECFTNIGAVYVLTGDLAAAEENYKQAIAINPNAVEAYNGLANIYNTQKKFADARAMSAEATKRSAAAPGGGNAGAFYNQAVIVWNAPDADPAEVQGILAKALQADPNHADAHFLMGNVLVRVGASDGDMAKFGQAATHFETYLKLAPSGPNAARAKESFEQLKTFRK